MVYFHDIWPSQNGNGSKITTKAAARKFISTFFLVSKLQYAMWQVKEVPVSRTFDLIHSMVEYFAFVNITSAAMWLLFFSFSRHSQKGVSEWLTTLYDLPIKLQIFYYAFIIWTFTWSVVVFMIFFYNTENLSMKKKSDFYDMTVSYEQIIHMS